MSLNEDTTRKFILEQAALLPEILAGLDAIVSGDETADLTCAAIKRISGRRDKGVAKKAMEVDGVEC